MRSGKGKPGPACSILKIKGSEIQQRITELALEAAGPYAAPFREESAGTAGTSRRPAPTTPRRSRRAYFNYRKVSIYGGSNEIQQNIIAKVILGL